MSKKEVVPTPVFYEVESPALVSNSTPHFRHIAGLHSELVAVDSGGALWRWAWSSATMEPHPLVSELGLADERVKLLAGRQLRVAVATESGKVRSFA